MKHKLVSACGAAALLVSSVHASAHAAPVAPAAPAPAAAPAAAAAPADGKAGSVYLRCDGKPLAETAGVAAGRLLVILATAGLGGGAETADASKRLEGAAGVNACDDAIAQESDAIRKVELKLARAVHEIELKNYDLALADIDHADAFAGSKAVERGYAQSVKISELELQAAILVRQNRPAEAEQTALKMVALAPYDLVTLNRAYPYVVLTPEMSPAKQAYFDLFGRMSTPGLIARSEARQWAGDYAGAAGDYETLLQLLDGFIIDKKIARSYSVLARLSLLYQFAGDTAKSNALAAEAHAQMEEQIASGKALSEQNSVTAVDEMLDLQAIGRQFADGKVEEARAAFAARSRWLTPGPPMVAAMTAKLRAGAKPSELTGALARDPAAIRSDALTAKVAAIVNQTDADKLLFRAIRAYMRPGDFTSLSRNVWKTDKSRYLITRKDKAKMNGEMINVAPIAGIPAGEALLLHTALLARSRGKAGFSLSPVRSRLDYDLVLIGNAGDPGVPAGAMLDAATVINALSVEIPAPVAAP